jgi:hypothetical protein
MAIRTKASAGIAARYHAFAAIFGTARKPARFVDCDFGSPASLGRGSSDGG